MARVQRARGVLTPELPASRPRRPLAGLYPGYFALVMATGIVALALDGAGAPLLAQSLSVICVVAYAALTVLFALRFLRFGRQALGDLLDHARGPGYFTWVAGTCVCGSQLLLLQGQPRTAGSLWLFGLILLLILTYVFFSAATLRRAKPRMGNSLNGAWLLAVVAMQSVALLGTQLSLAAPEPAAGQLFLTAILFLAGTVLYLLVIGLIFYRFTFLPVTPAQLTAPYWINMGALAITTLAGLSLLEASPALPELAGLQPLLPGLALLFWSFGTWWIPLLVVFGAWRHFVARHPLSYSPEYWGLVFPLGMYSVATRKLQELFAFEVLGVVAQVFALLGFAAWLLTLLGMLLSWLPGRRAGAA